MKLCQYGLNGEFENGQAHIPPDLRHGIQLFQHVRIFVKDRIFQVEKINLAIFSKRTESLEPIRVAVDRSLRTAQLLLILREHRLEIAVGAHFRL